MYSIKNISQIQNSCSNNIIAAAIIIHGIFNKKEKMTITIDKEKYHAIEQKTKVKPEKYIEKKINDININDIK